MPKILEGQPAVAALASALTRVNGLVPYLTASIDPDDLLPTPPRVGRPVPADGQWMPCGALVDDPPWLGRIIGATGGGLGTDDPVVAASVFVQGYSYRLLTLTIACLTASAVVPDASAPRVASSLARNWPSGVAFVRPTVMILDAPDAAGGATVPDADSATLTDALGFVVDTAVERHLRPLLAAVRAGVGTPVGERLLWGNVAASAATAFRTMQGCLGPAVEPLAERFFALAPPSLQGLGAFCVVEEAGRRGWFWERTSCCLFDRLPDTPRCADCSLTPAGQRRRAYRDSLAG